MYAQLGSLAFELTGPLTDLTGRRKYSFAEHPVIEGKPRLQFTGEGLEERTLELTFSDAYCDPPTSTAELRAVADRHEAVPLFFASGTVLGRYVIEEIEETYRETDAWGAVTRASCRVQLREWVEGSVVEISTQRRRQATAATRSRAGTAAKNSQPNRPASTNPRAWAPGSITRTQAAP